MLRICVCVLAVVSGAGCAARSGARAVGPHALTASGAQHDTLEAFMGKVRALSARARPTPMSAGTVEAGDPALGAALAVAEIRPSAPAHRAVAAEYARLGILDKAHEHLSAAVAVDPRDAAAWDGLARIWRDWGLPHLGVIDAHRAVYFAPRSPVVHNTFGTLLQSLGHRAEARTWFERALELDPTATYALNNLCYAWFLDGRVAQAMAACRRALELNPDLRAARNNLALAYAADGDLETAAEEFAAAGRAGAAEYNLGIVHLARREYGAAARAFDAAHARRSNFQAAKARAREARRLASTANASTSKVNKP
jgi:Tfp pilus assembly protein PilF